MNHEYTNENIMFSPEYIASNPGSSFRGLHESFVNYGGNRSPEWLTCTHEQAAGNIANGYYAVAGKPMALYRTRDGRPAAGRG